MAAEPHTLPRIAPARGPATPPAAGLRLVCLFHLNLAFSTLEEEAQAEVVRRCYRPLLELVPETGFPIAVEASGWTLRRIAALDPGWIARARELLATGRLEWIGSAHAQCIAPLLPAQVNSWNLRLGREAYAELLGVSPRIALVCEQAYAPGMVPLYLDAGYEAIVVDWDNAYHAHPEWPSEHRRHPQRARGGGRSIPVVWSESIAFQKFQRFAHGELTLARYQDYVRAVGADALAGGTGAGSGAGAGGGGVGAGGGPGSGGGGAGALMLYANDAEIFNHRPGRFAAEPRPRDDEWQRIAAALRALREQSLGIPALPAEVLHLLDAPGAGHELALEAPDQPIPVKKQPKYNITRWAVSGRDDIGVNTRCWRLYERMRADAGASPDDWRALCEVWASDFRTHITDARWRALLARLEEAEGRWLRGGAPMAGSLHTAGPPSGTVNVHGVGTPRGAGEGDAPPDLHLNRVAVVSRDGDSLRLRAGPLDLRLNARRGLAIEACTDVRLDKRALFGTLEHGYFQTIDLGADFYSGHLVQESPLTHKVTDLERAVPEVGRDPRGRLCVRATVATELGAVEKAVALDPAAAAVELEWTLRWRELPLGSLRLGYVTLLPEAFDTHTLWYATHNGGAALERHSLRGSAFDHGGAVSALVSARQGLGVTGGIVLMGDAERALRVEIDQACARALGLMSFTPVAERWLARLCFTLTESDDTRRGAILRDPAAPQRARLRISAHRTGALLR